MLSRRPAREDPRRNTGAKSEQTPTAKRRFFNMIPDKTRGRTLVQYCAGRSETSRGLRE
jgi:hypothetical protein